MTNQFPETSCSYWATAATPAYKVEVDVVQVRRVWIHIDVDVEDEPRVRLTNPVCEKDKIK